MDIYEKVRNVTSNRKIWKCKIVTKRRVKGSSVIKKSKIAKVLDQIIPLRFHSFLVEVENVHNRFRPFRIIRLHFRRKIHSRIAARIIIS